MSVLFIVQLKINDPDAFASYEAKALSAPGRGKLIAVDNNPIAIEGNPHGSRVIVLEFDDEAAFHNWYDSREYREVVKIRLASTDSRSTLVHTVW